MGTDLSAPRSSRLDDSPPLLAIALLSAGALGYEILLMRLFSIIQWHHFAYMMISVALLGYGASGSFVAVAQRALERRFGEVFVIGAVLFGLTAIASFLLAQRVGFNPLEVLWDPRQPLRLATIYLLLLIPFFCAATCICLTFARYRSQTHRTYGADIVGAGAGALAVIAALFLVTPAQALTLVGAIGLAAAALASFRYRVARPWLPLGLLSTAILLPLALPEQWLRLNPSPYKELSQALQISGARIIAQQSSPLGLITAVESPRVPFRHAPGLSLNAVDEPRPQIGIFTDGEGMSALTRYDGRREPLRYLDYLTSALPYHLLDEPRVLVLGAAAGADVLQAIYHHARAIDAVELNPQVVELVRGRFAEFAGGLYSRPSVRVHVQEARGYVLSSQARYDLIQVALLDAFSVSSAGLQGLSESYLYTVEALRHYLNRLAPGGLLAITRWVALPPRDVLKLFATAITALEHAGVREPAAQLALIRGWKTATLLVKNGAFTPADIAAIKEFCRQRSFDVDYYPGTRAEETNRYNVLARADLYTGATALLGPQRERFIERYKFNIRPATDDRPYFFHFFKWSTLAEVLALKQRGGLPLLEWGYPVLIATLAQAVLASALFILLPLVVRRTAGATRAPARARVMVYFAALGLAFMFLEIAFIQKFILFLSHPLYAVAVVLSAFLIFAGLGSRYSERLRGVAGPVAAIAVIAVLYLLLLPLVFAQLMWLHDGVKIFLSLALIAPLAFAMGMPFPLGLARVAADAQPLTAWAWGINACTSVVAAMLASLLAIHFGFTAVVLAAIALYAIATLAFPFRQRGAYQA